MKENKDLELNDENIADVFMSVSELFAVNENAKHSILPALKAMWKYEDEILLSVAIATNQDFNFSDALLDNLEAYEETLEQSWDRINYEYNSCNDNPFEDNKLLN